MPLVAAAIAAGALLRAQAVSAQETIKVGILHSLSGAMAISGPKDRPSSAVSRYASITSRCIQGDRPVACPWTVGMFLQPGGRDG